MSAAATEVDKRLALLPRASLAWRRLWIGHARYPGLRPFHFGSVVLDRGAADREVRQALADLWASLSPHPCPPFDPIPGVVMFLAEEPDSEDEGDG